MNMNWASHSSHSKQSCSNWCTIPIPIIPGPQGPEGPQGPPGPQGEPGPTVTASISLSSHAQQTFSAPNYGTVQFDQAAEMNNVTLSPSGKFAIVQIAGLYLIEYGVRSSTGLPGICTISFNPGGIDQSGAIALSPNTLVTGSIIRRILPQTFVALRIESTDLNSTITLPGSTSYSNAFLAISRIGPYPS